MNTSMEEQMHGNGYAYSPFRVEWRPYRNLHTRDQLEEALELFAHAGVRAWWYSVSAKGSYPLFRSKSLPYRSDADTELFVWLVEEAHRRGISIFTWEYLNTAPLLAEQNPSWRFQYLDWEQEDNSNRDNHFVCYNSPYGELLKAYSVEVLNDLGFDGIWFDGCYLFSDHNRKMACCCPYCARKFKSDTGLSIPRRTDYNDQDFRRFMEWRYEDFTRYWTELSAYVRKQRPEKIVIYNYFNRLGHDSDSGSPLRAMPMEGMIASESCSKPYQLVLQHKILKALNNNYPTEVWDYMRDASQHYTHPDPEPDSTLYHCFASAAAGGYASLGIGSEPGHFQKLLPLVRSAMEPVSPYIGGEQPGAIGLVVSGATKDYARVPEDGHKGDALAVWRTVHGMHNMMNALHWPSEVLLDNMLQLDQLSRYQAVVLPDVQCLSEESAHALKQYAEQGGLLVILGQCGNRTLLGEEREKPLLDEWAGIDWRDDRLSSPMIEPGADWLGEGEPFSGLLGGQGYLIRTRGCQVWARGSRQEEYGKHKVWGPNGAHDNMNPLVQGEVVICKNTGAGKLVWMIHNAGEAYAEHPSKRTRAIIRQLLEPHLQLPIQTNAPANIAITVWRQANDRLAVHMLQIPDSFLHLKYVKTGALYPEELAPSAPFEIRIPGTWKSVSAPSGTSYEARQEQGELIATVRDIRIHGLLVLENPE